MRTRIQHKLSVSYLIILLISEAIASIFFLRFIHDYTERRVGENLRNQADVFATSLSEVAQPSDLPFAMNDLERRFAGVLKSRLQILDNEGIVLSDTRGALEEDQKLELPSLSAALSGKLAPWKSNEANRAIMHATSPIQVDGVPIGLVDLSTPVEDQENLPAIRDMLLAAFGFSLLAALILSAILARTITQPIARIKEAAQHIAEGDLHHPVDKVGNDEIADLGMSINRMALQLQTRVGEILRERTKMTTLLESMVDGVIAIDTTGRISFINQAAEDLLHLRSRDVLDRLLIEVWREPALARMIMESQRQKQPASQELIHQDRHLHLLALPYRTEWIERSESDGAENRASARPHNLRNQPSGKLSQEEAGGTMVILHDVTDLRRLEEMRSSFLSSVSHELRTPLTIIKGFAITVLDTPAGEMDPRFRRSLEVIDRETDRLSRLVDDLLELSRLRSHKVKLELAPLEAGAVVQETVQELQEKATRLELELTLELQSGRMILGDRDRLKQITMNLVDNALKYTAAGGKVLVRTRLDESDWLLEIEDTGVGIAAEEIPFLFERFFRGDDRKKNGVLGTGLGLSIVKELVDAQNGKIEVDSEVGRGTRVRVRFPLQSGAVGSATT